MQNREEIQIDDINHMDIANQINNDWKRDTILSFVNKSKNLNYSIRFKNRDKSKIKKKYINPNETQSAKRHNNKVVNLIFAYMIFMILKVNKDKIKDIYICPDHRPSREVHHFIQKISYEFGLPNLTQKININFINKKKMLILKKTPSHKLANKILKGRKKANESVNFEELDKIIPRIL